MDDATYGRLASQYLLAVRGAIPQAPAELDALLTAAEEADDRPLLHDERLWMLRTEDARRRYCLDELTAMHEAMGGYDLTPAEVAAFDNA